MKNFFLLIVAIYLVATTGIAFRPVAVLKYRADLEKSKVYWNAYKVGGQHKGYVNLKAGNLEFTDDLLTGGYFEMDMTNIECTDLKGASKDKLVGYLKSEDFFGVEKHPTAKFKIIAVAPQGTGKYKIDGNMTIKESTKKISFVANITKEQDLIRATANIQLDRTDYNVHYGSSSFFGSLGDKAIYNNFDLTVDLIARKTE
jgi:polyisoprenoid-binding protein YceI